MQVAVGGRALGGMPRITDMQATAGDYEDVTIVRLDDVLPEGSDVGVLQVDVEGFEEPALKGAINTIARCRPILILETVPAAFMESRVNPLGYQQACTEHAAGTQ